MSRHPQRVIHPRMENTELWPGPAGYPWAASGVPLLTREGILRRLAPGRLICTWTTNGWSEPTEGNLTMAATSDDDGQTWSAPYTLFCHPTRGLFTTELFVAAPNEVHAFLQTYAPGPWLTQLINYRSISRDGGRTWSTPNSLPGGIHNVWVNQGIIHSSGRWVIPVSWAEHCGDVWAEPSIGRSPAVTTVGGVPAAHQELPYGAEARQRYHHGNAWAHANHRYAVGVIVSDDHGATFRRCGYLCHEQPRHFFEPKVVELRDGRIVLLTRELSDGWLWRSDSRDRGESWSPLVRTDLPNPSSKVKLLRLSTGRILLLNNPTPPLATGGAGFALGRRNPLSLWMSDDDMLTWPIKVDLVTDPAGNLNYPDGYVDEAAGVLRFAWEDCYSVYLARVPLDIR